MLVRSDWPTVSLTALRGKSQCQRRHSDATAVLWQGEYLLVHSGSWELRTIKMLPVLQAETIILDLVQPLSGQEDVEVLNSPDVRGRILAAPVSSNLDFPHWDNSAMDGYAVRFADVSSCNAEHPAVLEVVEEIPAGYQPQRTIGRGQAARILTGSMMPDGADTVVMQEETKREGTRLFIFSSPESPQAFVRHQGAFYQAGNPLLMPGIALNAPEIAVLAAAQCTQVPVYRRLRVGILSTGSELVRREQPLQPGHIVDSNQYALAALVRQAGAIPQMLGIVPDDREAIKEAIGSILSEVDMVLSSGGVSVGDYDYVEQILSTLGAEIQIRSVAIKPGKPLTVATFKQPHFVLYFGLPGNPVSALVSFWRFVRPAIKKMSGLARGYLPEFVQAVTQNELRAGGKRETYLWGTLHLSESECEFELATGSHSSGNLINLAGTNALAVVPVGERAIWPGSVVRVLCV